MREIDQVRITLLRMFRGAVQLPQEIINEILKPFLNTRNAAIKVQAITKGYLVRFNLVSMYHRNQIALKPSMYHRNHNMMTARLRYRDAVRRLFRGRGKYGTYRHSSHSWKSPA